MERIPRVMRKAWACPDLPEAAGGKPEGYELPIPGSRQLFPDCPAFYLRTATDDLPAPYLVDGVMHPWNLIAPRVHELKAGAISGDDLPPKVSGLAYLAIGEESDRLDWEREEAKRKAKVDHGRR